MSRTGYAESAQGFTRVELLIVLAILAILAALLLPALSGAKHRAQATVCRNHLRQMGQALAMYVHDNGSKYPHFLGPAGPSYGDAVASQGKSAGLVYWSSKLYPYYPVNWTNAGYRCPGYRGITSGPFEKGNAGRRGSYSYNLWGALVQDQGWTKHFGLGPIIWWLGDAAVAEAQLSVPSEMLSIGESRLDEKNDPFTGQDLMQCGQLDLAGDSFAARHGKRYNQLFCDGHLQSIDPWFLFDPRKTAAMWNYDHQPHPEMWR